MRDYATTATGFGLQWIAAVTPSGMPQALDACVECCDWHALPGRIVLLWEGKDGSRASYTFSELKALSGHLANFFQAQGVRPGDCVADLLSRTSELLVTILGAWRLGAVYQPLFTTLGPKVIEHRVATTGSKVLVTNAANYDRFDELVNPPLAATVGGPKGQGIRRDGFGFWTELERYPTEFRPIPCSGKDPFLMMFISGTTGPAKPVPVPLKAIFALVGYLREAVDLRPEDAFRNPTDSGRVYGLYYIVVGPLAMGHLTTFCEGLFSVESTCRITHDYGITDLVGSPTAYHLLMAVGAAAETALKGCLRAAGSAGGSLTPEVTRWFTDRFGTIIHDHYGQTELGMVLRNYYTLTHPVRVGAAGFACPEHRVVVLDNNLNELPSGQPGILAPSRWHSSPMWFPGYQSLEAAAFVGDYYLSGDTVELNENGSISFVGRADDAITTPGYRVGPLDAESTLIGHPAVMEVAVIDKPGLERTELVKAFAVLRADHRPTSELTDELQQYVYQRLSAHAYPREIEFLEEPPKIPSGKIQCFLLRNQEIARQREAALQAAAAN